MRQNIAGKINGLAEVENRILGARTPLCGRKNAIGSHGSGKSGARNRGHRTAFRLAPKAPSALLHLHATHEVALAQRHAVGAQDVVGRGGVEIEVGQRE
jgi:hypothetical protein